MAVARIGQAVSASAPIPDTKATQPGHESAGRGERGGGRRGSIARLVPRRSPKRVSKLSAVSQREHILTHGRFGVGRL
jgi:hypothetical protein